MIFTVSPDRRITHVKTGYRTANVQDAPTREKKIRWDGA